MTWNRKCGLTQRLNFSRSRMLISMVLRGHFRTPISKSPNRPAAKAGNMAQSPRRLIVFSSLLLFVGVVFLLLLNGQVFTNAVVFLGLCTISSLLWLPLRVPTPCKQYRRWEFYVLLGHLLVIIAFATGLRDRYHRQKTFNAAAEKLLYQSRTTPLGN